MELTNELFEIGKNSKDICVYLNEDYVLINKKMPIEDSKLEEYINSIKILKESGVNISSIEDYKLIDGTTSSFSNGKSYTKGVFLEERAKGNCIAEPTNIYLNKEKEYDLNKITDDYLKQNENYLKELEIRANANQDVYNKLVSDCLSLNDYNLTIDPKPLNFFYDKEKGYTIIDVIPSDKKEMDNEFFPSYIFTIIYGYGKSGVQIDFPGIYSLPSEMNQRFKECIDELNVKIVRALRNNNINEEYIKNALARNTEKMMFGEDMTKEELIDCINQRLNQKEEVYEEDISSLSW